MKTFLKTIGIFTIACSLPLSGYAGRVMTLKELNAFLEGLRAEGIKNLEPLREKIEKTRGVFKVQTYIGSKDLSHSSEEEKEIFLKEHDVIPSEEGIYLGLASPEASKARSDLDEALKKIDQGKSLITKVEYDGDKEPIAIEAMNSSPEFLLERLHGMDSPFRQWIIKERDPKETDKRFKTLSEGKEGDNYRKITFFSILKSNLFTDQQRDKASKWLKNRKELEEAIKTYAKAYRYTQKGIILHFRSVKIAAEKECDWDRNTFTFKDKITECPFTLSYVTPVSQSEKDPIELSEHQEKIEVALKELLPYRNGKEKVILLLLLEENTPPEYRLKWMHDRESAGYDNRCNALYFNFLVSALSHEIGHYLQTHLGLYQTYDDYETPFAKELLQMNNNQPEDLITVPDDMRERIEYGNEPGFYGLKDFCFKCPERLPAKKFFEYLQIALRWTSTPEISNILGIYFKGDMLYVCNLSDFCELKRIRYTHSIGMSKDYTADFLKDSFKKAGEKMLFEKFITEFCQYPIPTKSLRALCALHERPSEDAEDVVYDFGCTDEKDYREKIVPRLSDFIEAE